MYILFGVHKNILNNATWYQNETLNDNSLFEFFAA